MRVRRNELRQAIRVFGRSPGFVAVTVLVLAMGIGGATTVFTVFSALLLRPLNVPHPEQLVELSGAYRNRARIVLSYPIFRGLETQQRVFSQICGWSNLLAAKAEIDGKPLVVDVRSVTASYYPVLEEQPLLGRLIASSDLPGEHGTPVAVLSYAFWKDHFAADPAVVGKTLRMEDTVFSIIGVEQKSATGIAVGDAAQITVPAGAMEEYDLESRSLLWLNVTGRLLPGVSIDQARTQLLSFWPRLLEETVPTQSQGPRRQSFLAMGLQSDSAATGVNVELREKVQKPFWLLFGMVGLVLVLVCVNLASLTLARASARSHEVSTRIALGATPWQAVRPAMVESLLLAVFGAGAGLLLAYWGSGFLMRLLERSVAMPIALELHADWRVFCFAALSAIGTGLFIGAAPAWKLSRHEPGEALHASHRTMAAGSGYLGKILIVCQIAISLVLLQGAGLFLRNLERLRSFQPGFTRENLNELTFAPVDLRKQAEDPIGYRQHLAETILAQPGVHAAAFSLLHLPAGSEGWHESITWDSGSGAASTVPVTLNTVSPQFFATLAIPMRGGRDFTWQDDARHPHVAILDSLAAKRLFGNAEPIGKHIRFGVQPEYQDIEIVGVAETARLADIRDPNAVMFYVPAEQYGGYPLGGTLLVRGGDAGSLEKTVAKELAVTGRESIAETQSLEERSEHALTYEKMTTKLSSFFGITAVVVACSGLFGLISYSVTLRTREIGVRVALGSPRLWIMRLVLRQALVLTGFGIAAGIPLMWIAGRWIANMLFDLSTMDPLTLAVTSAMLLFAGGIAGYLPARRAMMLDPMVALRQE